jgi:hypothetical protein
MVVTHHHGNTSGCPGDELEAREYMTCDSTSSMSHRGGLDVTVADNHKDRRPHAAARKRLDDYIAADGMPTGSYTPLPFQRSPIIRFESTVNSGLPSRTLHVHGDHCGFSATICPWCPTFDHRTRSYQAVCPILEISPANTPSNFDPASVSWPDSLPKPNPV